MKNCVCGFNPPFFTFDTGIKMIVIDFTDLKRAITDSLNQTHTAHKSELDTLLNTAFPDS